MGQYYEVISEPLMQWVKQQKMFWVSTAPLSGDGHVNVSPKGGLYFGLVDNKTFWYMDLSGSGNETISHLYEPGNGRITIMLNAFEGPPRILRLFGRGRVLESWTPAFADFVKKHDVQTLAGSRSIIIVDIHQVNTSCGFSVPVYDFKEFRTTLNDYYERKAERFAQGKEHESMERNWALKNLVSIDGLPGLEIARKVAKEQGITPTKKMVGPMAPDHYYNDKRFSLNHLYLVAVSTMLITVVLIAASSLFTVPAGLSVPKNLLYSPSNANY
ncbi:hypothetical protein B0T17DRAFT_496247 [Bombardia bombarda]|uniref:Pyridoxamine 5'-phosphate oxidase N-terminal domain-containing protein n=1 Tax=Bombardia bombarda TaxID=252184 RepID=A0AA39WLX4_9PEZI|nr:hypothetical protein B0T17DRAFT_496247 [Bombardia bombarda]